MLHADLQSIKDSDVKDRENGMMLRKREKDTAVGVCLCVYVEA